MAESCPINFDEIVGVHWFAVALGHSGLCQRLGQLVDYR